MESELTCVVQFRMTFTAAEVTQFYAWHVDKFGAPTMPALVLRLMAVQDKEGTARSTLSHVEMTHLISICPEDHPYRNFMLKVLERAEDEEVGFGDIPTYDCL